MEPQVSEHLTTDLGFMEQLFEARLPTQEQFVKSLASTDAVQAILLLACGLLYMIYGWKAFKVMVIVNAAMLGTIIGHNFGKMLGGNMPWFGAFAGTILLAVLAWPLMRYAIGVMGCLTGAFLGQNLWHYVATTAGQEQIAEYAWAGSIMGLIALGLLAFVMMRLTIMIFTTLQGALMGTAGFLAILMKHESIQADLEEVLLTNDHLLPLIVAVPAVIGLAFQYSALSKKARKKRKSQDGD